MCRTITASELENKTDIELSALFRKVSEDAVKSNSGSSDRRNSLASLENISRAMRKRHMASRFLAGALS